MLAEAVAAILAAGILAAAPGGAVEPISPAAAQGRTDPKTWAKEGWQSFRWGMGKVDVEERLSDPNGAFKSTMPMSCTPTFQDVDQPDRALDCEIGPSAFSILDRYVSLNFLFFDGRLRSIALREKENCSDEMAGKLRKLLIRRYGAPINTEKDEYSIDTDWEPATRLRVLLSQMSVLGHGSCLIIYQDMFDDEWHRFVSTRTGDEANKL